MALFGPNFAPQTPRPLGTVTLEAAGQLLTGLSSSIFSPVANVAAYAANYLAPWLHPPINSILDAKHKGYLSWNDMVVANWYNGADFRANDLNDPTLKAWDAVRQATAPQVSPDVAVSLYNASMMSEEAARWHCKHAGLGADWQFDALKSLQMQPSWEDVLLWVRLGIVEQADAERWLAYSGLRDPVMRQLRQLDVAVSSPGSAMAAIFRRFASVERFTQHCNAAKLLQPWQQDIAKAASIPLPTIAEMTKLAQWGIDTSSFQALQPWLAEFPGASSRYWESHGMMRPMNEAMHLAPDGNDITPAALQWASHWTTVSHILAHEARSRCGPDSVERWRAIGLNILPFTQDSVRDWVKAEGYHPSYRDTIVAASYTPIGLRHIYFVAEDMIWSQDEFYKRFIGIGFAPDDARLMAHAGEIRSNRERWPWIRQTPHNVSRQLAESIVDKYQLGAYTREQTRGKLEDLHFYEPLLSKLLNEAPLAFKEQHEVKDLLRTQTLLDSARERRIDATLARYVARSMSRTNALNRLMSYGLSEVNARTLMGAAAEQELARRDTAKHNQQERFRLNATASYVKSIEDSYGAGLLTRQQALALLTQNGMAADVANALLSAQEAKTNLAESRLAVATVRRQYMQGQLTQPDALVLLTQAGLTQDSALRRIRFWAANLHTPRRIAAAQEILKWVQSGLLTVEVARQRLANLGWQAIDAQLALASAQQSLAHLQSSQAAAVVRSRASQVKQIADLQKQHQAQITSLQREAKRVLPLGTLEKWYRHGTVNEEYARRHLKAIGEPADMIDLYIEDWNVQAVSNSNRTVSETAPTETIPGPQADGAPAQ